MNPKDLKFCKSLIKTLISHKCGWPFADPVDPIKLNIPDYFEIIKNPMDFGTISKRLDQETHYSSPDLVHADVNLVFDNAVTYNPPNNDICLMAEELRKLFEKKWSAAKFEGTAASTPAVPSEKSKTPTKAASSTPASKSTPSSTPTSGVRKRKIEQEENTRTPEKRSEKLIPMTFDEKKVLGEKINVLATSHLGKVVEIIRKAISSIDERLATEENIEIDMEDLDTNTLRRLEKYVNSCGVSKPKEQESSAHSGDGNQSKKKRDN
eukprot:TRINITY_DN2352_c0_g1_i1.p1 TRINITY_DN2352_c0_g1~~TRINITY_DN2352_c0_g1_i1.p1  ORF type:complete len:307 (-),score=65.07 TRINITY_DN2352_c0_g1_i1:97-894(-)